jgi:hypothetical protein
VTGTWLPNKTLNHNHALWSIIRDSRSCAATAAPDAFNEEVSRESTIFLRDALGWVNSGSQKKQKKSEHRPALKPATHSQAELDLLNEFDWADVDKVQDMVLQSIT